MSRSLVSLVLQHPDKVGEKRKRAVFRAMRELGYRPNAAARHLARRRTDTIGVLVSDLHNPFYTEVLDGIGEAAEELGLHVLIASGGRQSARERAAADTFVELRAEGLILITPTLSTDEISTLAATVPTVIVARPGERPENTSRVVTDDALGVHLALDHLIGLGHRRIGLIAAGENPGARAREDAYRRAMAAAGLGDAVVVTTAPPTQEGGYRAVSRLLESGTRPTAVLASNDLAAVGALGAVADAGLRCPEHISIVGYDNTILAQLQPLSLTSVNQPRHVMGRTATNLLIHLAQGGESSAVTLEPQLVVRGTTSAPGEVRAR